MFADTGAFFVLLIYSLAVGGGLGALYDLIGLLIDLALPLKEIPEKRLVMLGNTVDEANKNLFGTLGKITARDVIRFFGDIIFFFLSALAVVILLYHLNYGEIRVFSLVSALAGFAVYRKTVGKPIKKALARLTCMIGRFIAKIVKILLKPIVSILKRTLLPVIEGYKLKSARRKTKRYLLEMEKQEEKQRKIKK